MPERKATRGVASIPVRVTKKKASTMSVLFSMKRSLGTRSRSANEVVFDNEVCLAARKGTLCIINLQSEFAS
ncbi:MAG: hypothetical protein E7582_00110 [Ruminococcaceae bacterium]|nr:hypothetical protein [Oscillospiraceae bacterium]